MQSYLQCAGTAIILAQCTLLLSQLSRPVLVLSSNSSYLVGLSHMMILSMQQPCVLDLCLAMLQGVCQYTYFLDCISETLFQGYTTLQSLVQCMSHRGIASGTSCSQARLRQAVQCIETHLRGYMHCHGELPGYIIGI